MKIVRDGVTIFEIDTTTGDVITGASNLSQPGGPHTHPISDVESLQETLDGMGGALTGEIKMWPLSSAPTGYLLCDGAAVSRATYAALYTLLGDAYGAGNGTTTFNVPNLKGRVPVGLDAGQTEFDAIAETGGSKTHTLTSAEMPSHTHTQNAHTHVQDAHSHLTRRYPTATGASSGFTIDTSMSGAIADNTLPVKDAVAVNQNATAVNQSTGGDGAHNNLQPYLVMNYIIKT